MIQTNRFQLIPATVELGRAEMDDRPGFARRLRADVPENWPPEMLADALPFFQGLLEANPSWGGWLGWYAVAQDHACGPVLAGSVGFKGPPDGEGRVEVGFSVLPQFQRRGYATEMVAGLIAWAWGSGRVREVIAQTTDDNVASRSVLSRLGFEPDGPGTDPDSTMYRLHPPRS